ncbi:MAG: AbrB family transcriptional regulator, partial [Thermoprotei archaeon]
MYKIVKMYKNGIIKLPADVRREAGLDEGDELLVLVRDRRIVLIPRGVFDPVEV